MLCVLTPGCAVATDELDKAVVRFDRGGSVKLVEAPSAGAYELRRVFDDRSLATQRLEKGDPLGFDGNSNDRVTAVAGAARVPVALSRLHPTAFWIYRSK